MMKRIMVPAYAKINLSLDVIGKRSDGYHNMRMIMQSIELSDKITAEKSDSDGVFFHSDLKFLPKNGKNLASYAAEHFMAECGIHHGVKITLKKNIPVSAGLAGGSTDAAAVLVALNLLFDVGLTDDELRKIGKKLGADIPFCINGGTALVEGIGDIISPLSPLPKCHIVLCKPRFGVSTAYVFSKINCSKLREHPDTNGIVGAINSGNLAEVARRLYNVMETVTAVEHFEISEIKNTLLDMGALGCAMSGSGPTVFGIFDSLDAATDAYRMLKACYHETYLTSAKNALHKDNLIIE